MKEITRWIKSFLGFVFWSVLMVAFIFGLIWVFIQVINKK